MRPHITFAHTLWKEHLKQTDIAIDATCGNGHDSAFLALLCAHLHCIDLQEAAINSTKNRLQNHSNISYHHQSHETFPPSCQNPSLIVYNLGYLPGSDKTITTLADTTQASLLAAKELLLPGGLLTITLYPGHPEGYQELLTLSNLANFTHYRFSPNPLKPSLLTYLKV